MTDHTATRSDAPELSVDLTTACGWFDRTHGRTWGVSIVEFHAALDASVRHAFRDAIPARAQVDDYVSSLHHDDLALALACAAGSESAWEHFVREHRPVLYRAADALVPSGGARDLADSLFADLFGLSERDGARRSLFRYFHGRSRLATWLRAVLAQRHVDRIRETKATAPLPEDAQLPDERDSATPDPERPRFLVAIQQALGEAVSTLPARDRLRLRTYYVQGLTLAVIGRLLGEHEATVSRHLARTRAVLRGAVTQALRQRHGLDDAGVETCLTSITRDPGSLDLASLIGPDPERKHVDSNRSR